MTPTAEDFYSQANCVCQNFGGMPEFRNARVAGYANWEGREFYSRR